MRVTVLLLLAALAGAFPGGALCQGLGPAAACADASQRGAGFGTTARSGDTWVWTGGSASESGAGIAAWSGSGVTRTGVAGAGGVWGASGGLEATAAGIGPDLGFGAGVLQPGAGVGGCVRPVRCLP